MRCPSLILLAAFLAAVSFEAAAQPNEGCVSCHDDIAKGALTKSVHGQLPCDGCHADVVGGPHEVAPKAVDCASCHPDAVAAWSSSLHAKGLTTGIRSAQCADCHGPAHEILPSTSAASRTYRTAIPRTCGRCHAQKFVVAEAGLTTAPAVSYQDSVHGRAAARGSMNVAVCTDCHDAHAVLPGNDPQSGIFKFNVGRTCGKCHAAIAVQYRNGVHGQALARGNWNSPVCTDCHGIHAIARVSDTVRGPRASCAHCHESVQLTQEFAVPVERVGTYRASYHGLARRMGSKTAADCASCHDAHNIIPSSDRWSPVNRNNLAVTCGKCHPGAKQLFGSGPIHVVKGAAATVPEKVQTWIRWLYIAAILGAGAFMLSHNLLAWWFKASARRRASVRRVVRMNRNQRIQHFIMLTTFIVLALSGFALVWPESWLGIAFVNEAVRRWVHRIAAIIMILLGVYHAGYMLLTPDGRKGLRDFFPRFSDIGDVFRMFRYYLGLSPNKPQFRRFGYSEKLEYWAGMWGTIVMAMTGLAIWFAVFVTTWLPRWWIDIATTIHLYEAILATMSILLWHLYHVIFDPDVYPMNWAWYDGRMSEELYKEEHPLDAE
ncbi:MAG TPA: cytochrome b/b6 domain-containing protein [Gemmatimonadaceae bacterium]